MRKMFVTLYDPIMKPLELVMLTKVREKLLRPAYGKVLEIGSGTGLNFPYYPEAVVHVTALEPQRKLREKSLSRSLRSKTAIEVIEGEAEKLPFADNSFDTVVNTLVFCTIPDPEKALSEILRVAKPGATVLFYEHVRPPQKKLAVLFDKVTPAWKAVADGCHLNRDTEALIRRSGLKIIKKETAVKRLFVQLQAEVPS
nr:class I SAM-dependent methyltransferase [Alkalicoccus halolimnae]